MKFFTKYPNLTIETRVIIGLIALLSLMKVFLGEYIHSAIFLSIGAALIGMLYMHLHDVRKYGKRHS